jgi:hypothetical protein
MASGSNRPTIGLSESLGREVDLVDLRRAEGLLLRQV